MELNGIDMAKKLWEGFLFAMQWKVIDLPGEFDLAFWMIPVVIGLLLSIIYIIRKQS